MEYEIMGKRRIIRKGGSATVTVPAKVMRYLGNPDDSLYFIRKGNDIVLRNVKFEEELIEILQILSEHPEVKEELDLIKKKYGTKM